MKQENINPNFGLKPDSHNNNKICVAFAAIDKYLEDHIIKNTQKQVKGKELVEYGDRNAYPYYLMGLYENVAALKSVINGIADYAGGEEITINIAPFDMEMNSKGETIEDLVRLLVIDYVLYGGFALNVLRNAYGNVAELYVLDFRNVRSNKDNTIFYYSTEWGDKSAGRVMATTYPAFDPKALNVPSSILYVKNDKKNTYPSPMWSGAINDAECLKNISTYNLNSLFNGLSAGYVINFCQGQPTDEQKEEISDEMDNKFSGFQNASRILLNFCDSYDNRATIEALPEDKTVDRYNSIYQTALKNIFTSFRIHPAIIGLPTDNSGFNSQDLAEGFRLFNQTVVLPIQKMVKRTFEKIFQAKDVLTIEPLKVDFGEETTTTIEEVQ